MPKKKTQKVYFGEEQEEAVIRFLESTSDIEKNKIFKEYLEQPLITMVESLIRRYKLYRKNLEFYEILNDTMSFLITKVNKFDHTKNHKAYSYFGTICKNYLMGIIQKDNKEFNRSISYEDISTDLEDNADFSYVIDEIPLDYLDVISKLLENLETTIQNKNLTDNEKKLGYALIEIISNYDKIITIGDGDKFNKNLILLYIREMTGLTTKDIRVSLKYFKSIYKGTLNSFI
jgi:hypothetical protein